MRKRAMEREFPMRERALGFPHEKKGDGVRGDHKKKSDTLRVHSEKERWGEFTIRKSNGVRVHHEKKSQVVRVHHEKEQWGESFP